MPIFLCYKVDINYLMKTVHEVNISVYWNNPLNPFASHLSAIRDMHAYGPYLAELFVLMSSYRRYVGPALLICREPLRASLWQDVILSNSGGSLVPTAFVRNNNNGAFHSTKSLKNRKYICLAKGISVIYRNKSQYFYEKEGDCIHLY